MTAENEITKKQSDEFLKKADIIRDAIPEGGLFAEKAWRISPTPFPLDRKLVKSLEKLGPVFLRFQQACDVIYRRSRKGTLPGWIADYFDQGKPTELLETGLSSPVLEALPIVIRPDLILTEDGFTATELDSVPGGIGLTAWLGQVYAKTSPCCELIGGEKGMIEGFSSIFGGEGADILVSEESGDYRPEMEWIVPQLPGEWTVNSAEDYEVSGRNVYRFFELFDLENIPSSDAIAKAVSAGDVEMISPFKPWIEEKNWAAMFWSHPLKDIWRRELREGNFNRLRKIFPRSWVVDPAEVPHHAEIPGLNIQHFSELKNFSQTERELVLKLSGFNERAWGAKSVTFGQDVSQVDWGKAVDEAIDSFGTSPYVLQKFHGGKLVNHPWVNEESGELEWMEGRVRLCPYYFVEGGKGKGKSVKLGGVLATICPSDKKILHGMRDAILVPCCIGEKK
ncbi:MAG: hypothetical protein KAG66_06290 [Methylococcales bacterium]|nr:hypothetical protein [Methylococcales bacterium]